MQVITLGALGKLQVSSTDFPSTEVILKKGRKKALFLSGNVLFYLLSVYFADLISNRCLGGVLGWGGVKVDCVVEMDGWGGVEVEGDGARAREERRHLDLGTMSLISASDTGRDWDLTLSMFLAFPLRSSRFFFFVGYSSSSSSSLPSSKRRTE